MTNAAASFWRTFEEKASSIRELIVSGDRRGAFHAVERLLADQGYDLSFDLTEQERAAVLIFSPEGDQDEAARIDSLMALKPPIPDWKVYGRRQRGPLEDAYAFIRHIYDLKVEDATFAVKGVHGAFDITMCSNVFDELSNQESEGLIATFLDHALGEDFVMSNIVGMHASSQVNSPSLSARELVDRLLEKSSTC